MATKTPPKSAHDRYSFADYAILILFIAFIGALIAGFGWMVHYNAQWERKNHRRAEQDLQRTASTVFEGFAAVPPPRSEAAFRGVLHGHKVDLLEFSNQGDRTETTIRIHEYYDNSSGRVSHFARCFHYSLLPPAVGASTYQEVECPTNAGLSPYDFVF